MLVLVAAAFAIYAGDFGHDWTFDDFPVIVENPDVRSLSAFMDNAKPGRPLRELTYVLDHALFGLNPAGWHIQQIFWHGLNAFLLYLLALRLGGRRLVAWFAALLFLAHPLQVEVVANLSHRKDSLALAFSLLAVHAWGRALEVERRRLMWGLTAFGMAWVAYQAKQIAVVLPLLFCAWELAFVPPRHRFLCRFRWVVAAGAVTAVAAFGYWFWFDGGMEQFGSRMVTTLQLRANYFAPVTLSVYYQMMLKSWAFMLGKVLWPFDLAVEYTYVVPASWFDPWVLAGLGAFGAYGSALVVSFKRFPALFFCLCLAGALWLATSNIWPLAYFAADRYLYAPMAGMALGAALLCGRLFDRPAAVVVGVVLLSGLAALSWQQSRVWASPQALWTQALAVSPRSSFALNNMGNLRLMEGDLSGAKDYYLRSVEVNPVNSTGFYNLGTIFETEGNRRRAFNYYRRFLAMKDPLYKVQADQLRQRLKVRYGLTF